MKRHEPASFKFATATGSLSLLEVTAEGATLTRLPRELEPEPALRDLPTALPRDGQPVAVPHMMQFGVGVNRVFVLDLHGDRVPGPGTTSPIRSIEALLGPSGSPGNGDFQAAFVRHHTSMNVHVTQGHREPCDRRPLDTFR
ncbi:hypothetical protein KRR55_17490 [Paeniglutamicibacter sp. ABSL32-1]|uniref:hypothetical protein n=1 Tax=Paeniglutamicibacter quisquiliarum TaxID=2849498 RepID=UPI001C2D7412|nr:hypothetical protein [Paeniglutamicibacter quisquiliarum]MBV1780911.1 hypothetical protein [Paeniglutamicibacter quisquiliarum]